jgi:hypothetical protein
MASQQASEQQFQAWEAKVDQGVPPFEASRMVGTTLRRLENGDAVRKQKVMELAKERQAALVETRTEAIVSKPDPPAGIFTAYQKANHPDYADRTQIEISGTVEHEHRGEFTLGHLIATARKLGVLEQLDHRPEAALPAAREVPARPARPA